MEGILKELIVSQGPLGLGWVLALWLLYQKAKDDLSVRDVINRNTHAMIEFKTLLKERLHNQGGYRD